MTSIRSISAEKLKDLDVREGDTLHILAAKESSFLIEIKHADSASTITPGKASEWLHTARGSVRQATGKSADDLQMDYYMAKYDLSK